MANQVDFKILPSDQFNVYSPQTRSDKIITYFTLLSKLRGDILAVGQEDDPNDIVSAYYSNVGGTQTLHLVKADGSEITASQPEQVISGTLNYVSKFTSSNDIGDSQIFDDGTNVGIGITSMTHKLQLGTGGVFADYFQLDTTYSNGFVVGAISWDQDNGTADIGLSGSLKLKIGQDDMWYVKNQTGSPITKGTAVYASGTLGASGRILVSPMIANGTIPARFFLGIVAETIANGADGYVMNKGKIRQINTNAYNEGDVLWVSPTTAGALTATEPTAPNLKLAVAFVVHKNTNGVIAVRSTTGVRIADASDVEYSGAADNSFLVYNSSTGVWEDENIGIFKTIAVSGQSSVVADAYDDTLTLVAGTNVTITTNASTDTITINATDQYVGTVTSVDMSVPTGFAISGNPITTSGTLALAFAAGYSLPTNTTQANWTTAYNDSITAFSYNTSTGVLTLTQQDAGTLTATVTLQPFTTDNLTQGSTNLYDKVVSLTGAGTTVVTGTYPNFTITSNDQHVGTVTSIETTAPITGGTITSTGTIGITQSGASSDGYLSSTDWNTFNSKEPALTKGNLTETTSSVLTITGGTGAVIGSGTTIAVSQASSTTSGYLSSTDWTTFNNKQSALTFTAPLVNTSGTVTITQSGASTDGYLSSTDWNTFNSKEPALTKGNLTEATSAVLTITGGTGAVIGSGTTIQVAQSSSTTSGYLSSTDWNTFNGKAGSSFTTIAVTGQSDIVADSASDTLTIAAGTGITLTTAALTDTLTITNSAPDQVVSLTGAGTTVVTGAYPAFTITSNDQYNGTVTSVAALTIGTTGTDLSSTVANGTTTPVITLNVPTASATNRGALSSTDWTTFNGKQNTLTFTSPLVNTANTITINQSSSTADGYLSSTDWTTFNGKASNSFTTIAVASQTSIVADSATDTLTLVAGTGISLTTNATTDTLTITNTAATSISCFSGYSSTGITLAATGTAYDLTLDVETVKDATIFSHSTSTNSDEVTVLAAGTYEISYSGTLYNANYDQDSAAAVVFELYKNATAIAPLNTAQTVSHVNIDNYNYINQVANSYILTLAANDVIKLSVTANYQAVGPHSPAVIFGFVAGAKNNLTIKKIG